MRILLLQIDKTQEPYLEEGIQVYTKRLKNYTTFITETIQMPKAVRLRTEKEQKTEEAKLIFNVITPDDFLALLDENGTAMSSIEFSQFISKKQNASTKRLVFLIGGPYGFDQRVYDRANFKVSFSQMTFSHQMIRLFFSEQLYRAFSILKGEKYHHS
jgi:23S rRNA (pseudouridine1915-N3)-methyltransferase